MVRPPSTHPTDGELELLQVLWQNGPCGLGQICAALRQRRPIATTTVATNLKSMLEKSSSAANRRRKAISGRPRPRGNRPPRAWSASWSTWSSTARPSGWWPTSWNPTNSATGSGKNSAA